jgi:hypothetical protein
VSVHLKRLVLALAVFAATVTIPATAASAAPEPAICKTKAACADGGLSAGPSGASSRTAGDVGTMAYPVTPPPVYPPNTPCYHEEVYEEVYETATYTTMYTMGFMANVCLFPDTIVLYGLETSLFFPNGVQDPRLTELRFVVRDQIVNYPNPRVKDGYSEVWVTFCPAPGQCQRYLHRLGLMFNPAWVYPFSVFERFSS